MSKSVEIPFTPSLSGRVIEESGKWGVIIAHGVKSTIEEGLIPSLMKKLAEKNISSLSFNFPFRESGSNSIDDIQKLDQAYEAAWNFAITEYSSKKWVLCGHDIGAEVAIRTSGLVMTDDGQIPPVISISYPLYPPNRPEQVQMGSIGAVMGEVLFIQPDKSNQGSFDRLRNQLQMMVPHADMSKIRNANHEMVVEGKTPSRVAFWITNDIQRFLNNLY